MSAMERTTFREAIKQEKFDQVQTEAALNIMFTANFLEDLMRRLLKQFDISHEQYNVLRILRGHHPEAYELNEIRDRMLNRWSNVSRLVEKLRRKGYLTRQPKPENRRKVEIRITDEGLQFINEIDKKLIIGDLWQQSLPADMAGRLSEYLDDIRNNLNGALERREIDTQKE